MSTRVCTKCGIPKPLDEKHYRPIPTNPGCFSRSCRKCQIARNRERERERLGETVAANQAPVDPVDKIQIDVDPAAAAYAEREVRDERRETKRQRDALLDENVRLKAELAEVGKLNAPIDVLVYERPEWERSDAVACAIASDWHVEEGVDRAAVHGLNEYSLDIARARSESFFKNLLRLTDMMARESKVTTIFISALGDFFSGFIHEELLAANALAPGDAARFWRGLFASGIDFLLRESSYQIEIDAIPGNHGRMTKRVWFSDPTGTSLETFAYHALAGRYEDSPRVRINVASHAIVYRKFFEKLVVRQLHGYEVNYGGGVGGLTIPLRKALARWDKAVRADLTLLGHFHQRLDGGDFLVNGSMIGFNEYAQSHGFSPEEAQQSFFLVHARAGGQKSIVAPIWLDDAHKRDAAMERVG